MCGLTENVSEECVEGGKDLLFPEMKSSTLDFPTLFRTLQFEAAFVFRYSLFTVATAGRRLFRFRRRLAAAVVARR